MYPFNNWKFCFLTELEMTKQEHGMFSNQVSLQCNTYSVINYRRDPEPLALSAFGGDAFPKT